MWLSKGELPKFANKPAELSQAEIGSVSGSAGIRINATGSIQGVDASVETIAQAMRQLSDAERLAVASKIGMLAHAHDSATLKQSIIELLTPSTEKSSTAFAQKDKKAA